MSRVVDGEVPLLARRELLCQLGGQDVHAGYPLQANVQAYRAAGFVEDSTWCSADVRGVFADFTQPDENELYAAG